jgi:hypothetical protein
MYTNNFGDRRPMSNFLQERVLDVRHWTEALFSFTTTRDPSFRFENGQFTMIGLEVEGRPSRLGEVVVLKAGRILFLGRSPKGPEPRPR